MNINCVECGRFMGTEDFVSGHCAVEPLSEFGPERIEWSCRKCAQAGEAGRPKRGATRGSVHEHAVGNADAPKGDVA